MSVQMTRCRVLTARARGRQRCSSRAVQGAGFTGFLSGQLVALFAPCTGVPRITEDVSNLSRSARRRSRGARGQRRLRLFQRKHPSCLFQRSLDLLRLGMRGSIDPLP
jgi:hypothetical protein